MVIEKIPPAELARLKREAVARGIKVSELVRRSITRVFPTNRKKGGAK